VERQLDAADDVRETVPIGCVQADLETDRLIVGKSGVHGEIGAALLVEETDLSDGGRGTGCGAARRQRAAASETRSDYKECGSDTVAHPINLRSVGRAAAHVKPLA
jgi:hypothetical protein